MGRQSSSLRVSKQVTNMISAEKRKKWRKKFGGRNNDRFAQGDRATIRGGGF